MIKNRTIFTGDNLPILRRMDSESVDLIYLDPPFNSNRHYSAPIGSRAAGAEFKDGLGPLKTRMRPGGENWPRDTKLFIGLLMQRERRAATATRRT